MSGAWPSSEPGAWQNAISMSSRKTEDRAATTSSTATDVDHQRSRRRHAEWFNAKTERTWRARASPHS
jgi:hypothetical protein